MRTEFAKRFLKDLEKVKTPKQRQAISEIIEQVSKIDSFKKIPSLKKLVGFEDAYRIRVGQLRIGVFFDGETVLFARIANQKDIYRIFL